MRFLSLSWFLANLIISKFICYNLLLLVGILKLLRANITIYSPFTDLNRNEYYVSIDFDTVNVDVTFFLDIHFIDDGQENISIQFKVASLLHIQYLLLKTISLFLSFSSSIFTLEWVNISMIMLTASLLAQILISFFLRNY